MEPLLCPVASSGRRFAPKVVLYGQAYIFMLDFRSVALHQHPSTGATPRKRKSIHRLENPEANRSTTMNGLCTCGTRFPGRVSVVFLPRSKEDVHLRRSGRRMALLLVVVQFIIVSARVRVRSLTRMLNASGCLSVRSLRRLCRHQP